MAEAATSDAGAAPEGAGDYIRVLSADDVAHEFPAGTPQEAIDKAMKTYAEQHADKTTVAGQVGRGMMDPAYGLGQLASHVMPSPPPIQSMEGKDIDLVKEGDKIIQEREANIQKERGINRKKFDWSRSAGEMLSPINFIGGMGAAKGAQAVISPIASRLLPTSLALGAETAGAGIAGGAASGAMSPSTTPEQFANDKLQQVGLGGLLGGAFGVAAGTVAAGLSAWGNYLARTHPDNLLSDAVVKILKRIKQDQKTGGPSATDALDLVNAADKPIGLVDVGGENLQGLGGNVARQPGESRAVAQTFLKERDEEAAKRLSEDIAKHVSGGPTAFQATEGLLESRSVASAPLYKQAQTLQNVWSPRLDAFLQDPALKVGLQRGYEIERLQSLARGEPLTATQMGVDVGVDGSTKILGKPNVRVLDMGKQGLDAMIADERNEITGRLSARGVALENVRKEYVKAIDEADSSGIYKRARQTWAGYSASLDSLKQGRAVFGASPEENAAAVMRMSSGDREFYRMGVADILKERLAKGGFTGDESKQIIKNPWMRDQLKPAFESRAEFDAFIDAVTAERQMFDTRGKVMGNSATAGRQAEDAVSNSEGMGKLAQFGAQIASGHPLKAISSVWKAYQDLGLKPNPELNEKVAQILFTTQVPEDAAKMLRSGVIPSRVNPKAAQAGRAADLGVMTGNQVAGASNELTSAKQDAE